MVAAGALAVVFNGLGLAGGDDPRPDQASEVVAVEVPTQVMATSTDDLASLIHAVVYLASYDCERSGSGTIVGDGRHILTNAHVVERRAGSPCEVGIWFTKSDTEEVYTFDAAGYCRSRCEPDAVGQVVAIESTLDLAILELRDPADHSIINAAELGYPVLPLSTDRPEFREDLFVLGYPGSGGLTITTTDGIYSGLSKDWPPYDYYKTDATINHGNSGGAAFTGDGRFIGVPTAGTLGELECDIGENCVVGDLPYGLIRPNRYAVPLLREALD